MNPEISKNITYKEAIFSAKAKARGLDNQPKDPAIIVNMQKVANECFEKIRAWVGNKIYVSSFYRSVIVNAAVHGEPTSNHLTGCAIDMDFNVYGGKTNKEVFDWCVDQQKQGKLDFDELLWEGGYNGWIHIAYRSFQKNRRHVGTIPDPK